MNSDDNNNKSSLSSPSVIYYFGYGPIVHPVVRHRRNVKIASVESAILYDHRLTFAYGGVVNAVKQRGYEVYGVLLQFDNVEEWNKFQAFDAGYDLSQVQIYPLKTPDDPVMALTFIMKEYDPIKLDIKELEILPQERYLTLIASGMKQHHIDYDYIQDQILSVPYVSKTTPSDYKQFPYKQYKQSSMKRSKQSTTNKLPVIAFHKYQHKLCRNAKPEDVYFICGHEPKKVIRLDDHDPNNPCSIWIRQRVHGHDDLTLLVHQTVVDPDIPMVDAVEDLTLAHYTWAENHMYEYLQQGGLSATAIYELQYDNVGGSVTDDSTNNQRWWKRLSQPWTRKKNKSSFCDSSNNSMNDTNVDDGENKQTNDDDDDDHEDKVNKNRTLNNRNLSKSCNCPIRRRLSSSRKRQSKTVQNHTNEQFFSHERESSSTFETPTIFTTDTTSRTSIVRNDNNHDDDEDDDYDDHDDL